jgi:hypothetical protein
MGTILGVVPMPSVADKFLAGRPVGVSNVVKDGSGKLKTWTENGFACEVLRNGSGQPTAVTATSPWSALVWTFQYDGSGALLSQSGQQFPTAFVDEILKDANGLGGGSGGGLSAPVAKSSLSTDVQTSLGKADTALQAADIAGKADTTTVNAALAQKAPLASPAFTGTPTVPTAAAGTNTTQAASTAFVAQAVAALVASSPSALDTLNELASALGNDANFATTVTNALAQKADATATTTALAGKAPAVTTVQITANVTITTANQATYNGQVLEFTGAFTVTISAGLVNDFGFAAIPPSTGNATIASDGTAQLNGATTSITRAAASYTMFGVQQRASSRNAYVVS